MGEAVLASGDGTEDRGDHCGLGFVVLYASGASFVACCVDERDGHREMPAGWDVGAEHPFRLAALDERDERSEHGLVAAMELFGGLRAGGDGDERVVAPEGAPGRGDDAPQGRLGLAGVLRARMPGAGSALGR